MKRGKLDREFATVVTSRVGHFTVALDARLVESVRDLCDLDSSSRSESLDLARWFEVKEDAVSRKALRIRTPSGPYLLLVGAHVQIEPLLSSQLRKIPNFIASLCREVGILGFVLEGNEALVYLLDGARLAAYTTKAGEAR